MKVTIMSGLPGSGKSTLAKKMLDDNQEHTLILSTDTYYINSAGVYEFKPENAHQAHNWCLRLAMRWIDSPAAYPNLIIDNTNLSGWEIAPYYRMAEAWGREVEILRVVCDPEVAFSRQTHGVPREKFNQMVTRFCRTLSEIPPWWIVKEHGA